MKRVVFIAKTNLNNDGRILNQMKILQSLYKDDLLIDFILFPDKPLIIDLGKGITVHEIATSFKNSSLMRFLTVFQFTCSVLRLLYKLRPSIIHVQDMAVVLPVYLYRLLNKHSFKLIYDDHEMPNENESLQYRFIQYFENRLMKLADIVIYANKERQDILDKELDLKNSTYFLNLPYFDELDLDARDKLFNKFNREFSEIRALKEDGYKFIIHQGSLEYERGREKLASFSNLPLTNTKIAILGVSETEFNNFINEYDLDNSKFYFIGSVPYAILDDFWQLADAAIIMYLPTYVNNRLCAPNRYFIALKNGMPTLVNRDNPVLSNFTAKYDSGSYIECIMDDESLNSIFKHSYHINTLELMKAEEIKKFEEVYENIY